MENENTLRNIIRLFFYEGIILVSLIILAMLAKIGDVEPVFITATCFIFILFAFWIFTIKLIIKFINY